jgi:hypothetical protein
MGRLVSLSSTDLSSYVTCPSKVSLAPSSTITVNCVNKTIAFTGCLHLTTQLSLERNHFTGSLPSDWGRLSLLEFLSVAYNKLTRSLPLSMANSTSLTFANFVSNSFSSTILPEFGALTNIERILFQETSFAGTVPRTIRRGTSLSMWATVKGSLQFTSSH